ncbi:phospho-sugar mutase, partial [Glutamicibacter creatinolyticus]
MIDSTGNAQLLARAQAWAASDPDPQTQAELASLIQGAQAGQADALQDLTERFSANLVFGTAGLRAELGAGPMRMNRVV